MNIAKSVFDDIKKVKLHKLRYAIFFHYEEIVPEELDVIQTLVPNVGGAPKTTLQEFIFKMKQVMLYKTLYISTLFCILKATFYSMATVNLNKSEDFVTNTTAASKYIPRRPRISIN